ncbi:hypothetical protein CYMTET_15701 [Cymbomonas tetramitiformis]|uniref:Prokaryotic-type class I peptide chain release factors domain-containing protein n=1 Tax=Cymbomonas tetramitiformis TaxID=36881 RepID=A0AAE0L929_9CHLO|nr:hypothetical protein CYMTET_15701 [Cymbomonas tetramitiformis]|eukprot:gene5214-6339_t
MLSLFLPWRLEVPCRVALQAATSSTRAKNTFSLGVRVFLEQTDDGLLKQCTVDRLKARSGPGGQHRNKVESGVRLTHIPTGTTSQAFEERSQHMNRAVALKRLREALALGVRASEPQLAEGAPYAIPPPLQRILPGAKQQIKTKHPDYPTGVALLLDLLQAHDYSIQRTGQALQLSTGKVSKLLLADASLRAAVNRAREARGLKPLR